ncbi:MAG: M20/M25/M40 family metallo-hydrolase [Bryobacteraceae bacterium]
MTTRLGLLLAACLLAAAPPAPTPAGDEPVDLDMVHRLRTESFEHSRVMEHMFYLTDVHGPRVTNSPGFRKAGEWAVSRLKEYGLSNVKLEKWGPFGRGWSYSKFEAHLIEPGYQTLIGFPMAWAPGTEGPVEAEPILAPMRAVEDFARYKGKLKGKIVLIDLPRPTPVIRYEQGRRLSDAELSERAQAEIPGAQAEATSPAAPPAGRGPAGEPKPIGPVPPKPADPSADSRRRDRFRGKLNEFLKQEGALVAVSTGYRGDGGTVFASAAGSYNSKYPDPPPSIAITPEHYNRIVRLLEQKIPVKVRVDVKAEFHTGSTDSFNVIGELPGSSKKDEVVMLGAHFDSWHGGTGATDNAAGSAVMMEAMRLLKSLDKPLPRTVRIALWGAEEVGLLGSKAYVKEHFADPEVMHPTSAHARLAGYFNYDNGSGRIRGVYLQGNDMCRPIFESWLKPYHDLGATTVTIRDTRGTDHLSFDAVGLPGFQFIQDPLEYETRTHHSNMDVYDHVQQADLKQAAAIIAGFAYHAATRDQMLPRKPLPKARPAPKQEETSDADRN